MAYGRCHETTFVPAKTYLLQNVLAVLSETGEFRQLTKLFRDDPRVRGAKILSVNLK
jgi:hypothetical protein